MAPEFLICVLSSELPLDGSTQCVSSCLPCIDFALQKVRSWNPTIQALAAEDADRGGSGCPNTELVSISGALRV